MLAATTGGNDHETFIWRVNDASIVHKLVGKGQAIWAVGWSQDRNTIAWGTTNTPSAPASVERTFDVTTFQFGSRPEKKDFLPAPVTNSAGFALEKKDANLIQIVRNGQPVSVFKSPFAGDRILGYCVLPSDRGVIGTGFGLFLLDLNTGKPIRHFQGHADMVTCLYPSPDGRHFLTGSGDQTISMWSTERNEPIMSFFFAGQDWIAWTPEGYYSCSANGERLMGWQINNGFERLGTFYEAVRFRQSLYRPEVIKHLVKTGDLAQAIAQAGQQQNQPPAQAVNVADVLPPQVKIMTPASDRGAVQLKDGKLEVVAAAKSVGNHPVTAMRLIVDGRPYRGEESIFQFANPQLGVRSASWNLELTPGQHFIQVQAESAVSKAVSDPLQVVCEGSTQELPNLYVLAIGINEYQGKMRLNFATQDAVALAEMLQSKTKGVFGRVEVQLLKDQSATKLNIVKGLLWMNSKMTANDVGIFFFGGHGLQDPWGNFHLVPVDVKLNNPGSTCIPGNAVKKALANMPGKLIAMFDACHSGAAAGGSGAVARPDDLMRDLVTEECGVIVMCSSLGSEYSMESPLTQHGFFTLGLLEGLEGKADFDNDQTIFIHEMDRYACLRVKQLSQGMQNPITARPPSIPSFALTKAN